MNEENNKDKAEGLLFFKHKLDFVCFLVLINLFLLFLRRKEEAEEDVVSGCCLMLIRGQHA